jgi:uncharacterized tellurite resistance protein B-like protein
VSFLRFLGLEARSHESAGDTATVRRIAARLEALGPEQARYLAAFAYVLARVAVADLEVPESETQAMEGIVAEVGHLPPAEAALAVEIAKSQARLLGGTENYVVTREFHRISTREQRLRLLRCLFAVAAADGTISAAESAEIVAIGEELGFAREEVIAERSPWRDKLSELKTKTA